MCLCVEALFDWCSGCGSQHDIDDGGATAGNRLSGRKREAAKYKKMGQFVLKKRGGSVESSRVEKS